MSFGVEILNVMLGRSVLLANIEIEEQEMAGKQVHGLCLTSHLLNFLRKC